MTSTQAEPLDKEIKEAVFGMGPLKSPGLDGLYPIFFNPSGILLVLQFVLW